MHRIMGGACSTDSKRRIDDGGGARPVEDVEEQERLVESYAERNPCMVDQSDAAIARELLKMVRRSIEHHGGAL